MHPLSMPPFCLSVCGSVSARSTDTREGNWVPVASHVAILREDAPWVFLSMAINHCKDQRGKSDRCL